MASAHELARADVLSHEQWHPIEAEHQRRVDELLAGHTERSRRGEKHPVEDFLFTYYSLRPAQLRRWHPGAGVVLLGTDDELAERLSWREHVRSSEPPGGVTLDVRAFLARRGDAVRRTLDLLRATAGRAPQLGCFGLHEWAMVYRLAQDDVRHAGWPLRLGSAGTDAVVEAHRIRCTHHDAFRFFTAEAAPLNRLQPRREDQVALEQPGCLHATMDLYIELAFICAHLSEAPRKHEERPDHRRHLRAHELGQDRRRTRHRPSGERVSSPVRAAGSGRGRGLRGQRRQRHEGQAASLVRAAAGIAA